MVALLLFIRRKADDISRLWEVFERAVQSMPLADDEFGKAFDAALEVRNTNLNLTMGLFLIRPFTFLSLDSTNQEYLGIKIPAGGLSYAFYRKALEKVKVEYKVDFPHL